MLPAVIRAKELEQRSKETAQPGGTGDRRELQARPVVEAARVMESDRVFTGNHGTTPLMRAACEGLAGTVQALIDRGAEVNAKRSDGFDALALAAFFGHSQVVWLLMGNGADLAATGRSETAPERWADARGFFEIGDAIRDLRAAESVKVSSRSSAVIDEAARFSRPVENERLDDPRTVVETAAVDEPVHLAGALENEEQGNQSATVETSASDEAARFNSPAESEELGYQSAATNDSALFSGPVENGEPGDQILGGIDTDWEIASAMKPAPLDEEIPARRYGSAVDVIRNDQAGYDQEQLVVEPSLRPLKALPEIEDPPPLVVPEFHPGSAFVARVASSQKILVALSLVVLLVGAGIAAFLFPNIRQSLTGVRRESAARTTELPDEPVKPATEPGTTTARNVENPPAPVTEPASAPTPNDIVKTPSNSPTENKPVETTTRNDFAKEPEKGLTYTAAAGESESRAHSSSQSKVQGGSEDKTDSAAPQVSRSGASARKQRAVARAIKLKPQVVSEEQPKPAPLSVETSRSRNVTSAPAESANDVPSQSPPPSLITGKPKSKVIQWP